jgi:hypothetical protein
LGIKLTRVLAVCVSISPYTSAGASKENSRAEQGNIVATSACLLASRVSSLDMEAILSGVSKDELQQRLADPSTAIRCLSNIRSGQMNSAILYQVLERAHINVCLEPGAH